MPRRLLRSHVESVYHCVSRVVDRNRTLGDAEKAHFYGWMRRLERFCGVQVVTYCLMENHFHLLVRVPCRQRMAAAEPLTVGRLRKLLPLIYSGRELRGALQEIDRAAAASTPTWMNEILARYTARRYSLAVFLKELKQRYTRWHNRKHRREGTLWEHRFRSVLVEGDETALLTVAAYIDLNPVRAGIVTDSKDYRWCGYAEALGGSGDGRNAARVGLGTILARRSHGVERRVSWWTTARRYRMLLFGHGERRDADAKTGASARLGMSREEVDAVLEKGGELSVSEILRCRVRYLTEGAAIGSGRFLEQVFEENRDRFGKARTVAGKRMQGSDWGGLLVLQGLQRNVLG